MEEDHLNIKIVTALLLYMIAHYLIWWKYVSKTIINLGSIPGMATFKKTEGMGSHFCDTIYEAGLLERPEGRESENLQICTALFTKSN